MACLAKDNLHDTATLVKKYKIPVKSISMQKRLSLTDFNGFSTASSLLGHL